MHPYKTQKHSLIHQHTHRNAQYMCTSPNACLSHTSHGPKYATISLDPGMTHRNKDVAKAASLLG